MSDTYHKVGTSYRNSFAYVTAAGAVTGRVQADFTIEVTKNGVAAASTGITITEVSAASNAGDYAVLVSGVTGFVAAVGTYDMVIYRTSVVADRWQVTVRVTTDGSGTGSYGAVSFTATASNGRVMSGGVPLIDAGVRIVSSAGNLIASTTSDATGLWGPIYFDADGTYSVYVQRSGYTTTSGTVVVSGAVTIATGPGADFTITAASSSSGLTASGLWAHFKRCLRDRSGSQADLLAQQGVDDALWMISQEREWPWYHSTKQITLQAPYATGTIAIVSGSTTVTLTSGTWPTWAASAELYIDNQWYPISTRSSATTLLLDTAWGNASITASTYNLAQTEYTLPDDLQSLDRVMFDQAWSFAPMAVSMATVLQARSNGQWGQARPSLWAIRKDELVTWPLPTVTATIQLLYYRRPPALASAADTADWDPMHLGLLRRAIEYQAALRGECVVGDAEKCMALYRDAFNKASAFDKSATDRDVSASGTVNGDDSWWRRGTTP